MEANQDTSENATVSEQSRFGPLKIAVVVILLAFPVIYLIYRTSHVPNTPPAPPAAAQAQQTNNVAELENRAKLNPTYDNLINLSLAYINNHAPGRSIPTLKKVLEINPNSVVAYNNLGVAYTMLEQYQNGIDACNSALKIDSTFQLAKNNLKWATDEKNKVLAILKMQEATPIKDRNATFYIGYGYNNFKLNNYDKSLELWKKALEADPKNTAAYNNMGTIYMIRQQYDKAIEMFNKVLEINPADQLGKNNLAWAQDEKSKLVGPAGATK